MDVRDAVEADADRLAELTGSPRDVMRNLVHDRTVRVAEGDDDERRIRGFVSYDARSDTVHITQFQGEHDVADRLLAEPVRFAERESMTVEFLVPEGEETTREAAEAAGFEQSGSGPTFEGEPTVRYQLNPR